MVGRGSSLFFPLGLWIIFLEFYIYILYIPDKLHILITQWTREHHMFWKMMEEEDFFRGIFHRATAEYLILKVKMMNFGALS